MNGDVFAKLYTPYTMFYSLRCVNATQTNSESFRSSTDEERADLFGKSKGQDAPKHAKSNVSSLFKCGGRTKTVKYSNSAKKTQLNMLQTTTSPGNPKSVFDEFIEVEKRDECINFRNNMVRFDKEFKHWGPCKERMILWITPSMHYLTLKKHCTYKDAYLGSYGHVFSYLYTVNGNNYTLKLASTFVGLMDDVVLYKSNFNHKNFAKVYDAFYFSNCAADIKAKIETKAKTKIAGIESEEDKEAEYKKIASEYDNSNFYFALIEHPPITTDKLYAVEIIRNKSNDSPTDGAVELTAELILKMGLDVAHAIKVFNNDNNIYQLDIDKDNIEGCIDENGEVAFKLSSFTRLVRVEGVVEAAHEFNHDVGYLPGCKHAKTEIRNADILNLAKVIDFYQDCYCKVNNRKVKQDRPNMYEKKVKILQDVVIAMTKNKNNEVPDADEVILLFKEALEAIGKCVADKANY